MTSKDQRVDGDLDPAVFRYLEGRVNGGKVQFPVIPSGSQRWQLKSSFVSGDFGDLIGGKSSINGQIVYQIVAKLRTFSCQRAI